MNTPVKVHKEPSTMKVQPAETFHDEMERFFDRITNNFGLPFVKRLAELSPSLLGSTEVAKVMPAVDIAEDPKSYKLTAELPGLDEKHIDVIVTDTTVLLKGEKTQEKEHKEGNYHLSERSYGAFQRSFVIPKHVDRDKIAAEFANGVLTVTLPKTDDARKQHKKIEIRKA